MILFSGHLFLLKYLLMVAVLFVAIIGGISIFNLIVFTPVLWIISILGGKIDSKNKAKTDYDIKA